MNAETLHCLERTDRYNDGEVDPWAAGCRWSIKTISEMDILTTISIILKKNEQTLSLRWPKDAMTVLLEQTKGFFDPHGSSARDNW